MYEAFYHLNAEPFRLCPDASFCFKHRSYAKARAYLRYAWHRAEGLAMVTGDPGTGKTTLANDLLGDLRTENVAIGRLVTTQVDADDLLRMVALAFGVELDSAPKTRVSECLKEFLVEQQRQGRRVLLVVDEAQDLARGALEELRLLTDLESEGHYLLQVFLFGHRVLQDILRQPDLAPLQQRFIVACHLEPLDREGTKSYVQHRLVEAGWRDDPSIDAEVFPLIHQASYGVPRRINLVCSRLLLHGYAEQRHSLRRDDVRQVVQDLRGEMLLSEEIEEPGDAIGMARGQTDSVPTPQVEPASVSANVHSPTATVQAPILKSLRPSRETAQMGCGTERLPATARSAVPAKGQEESRQPNRADHELRSPARKARAAVSYAAPMLLETMQRMLAAGRTRYASVRAALQGRFQRLIELRSFSGVGGPRDLRRLGYTRRYLLISLVASLAVGVTYVAVPKVVELAGTEAATKANRFTRDPMIPPEPQDAVPPKIAQPSPPVGIIEAKAVAPVLTSTPPANRGAEPSLTSTPPANRGTEPRKPGPLPPKPMVQVEKASRQTDRVMVPDSTGGRRSQKESPRPQAKLGRQAKPERRVRQARPARQVVRRSTASKQLVADIQSRLFRAGHDPGPIDGIPGPRTRSAIKAYQLEWGLAADAGATSELLMHLIEHRQN